MRGGWQEGNGVSSAQLVHAPAQPAVLCDRPPRPPRGTRAPAQFFYLSSAVHQAVVSARSAVPHAVGQVQVRWWGRVGAGRALHYSEPHAAAAAVVCSAGCAIAMWCTPHHHPTEQDAGLIVLPAMAATPITDVG